MKLLRALPLLALAACSNEVADEPEAVSSSGGEVGFTSGRMPAVPGELADVPQPSRSLAVAQLGALDATISALSVYGASAAELAEARADLTSRFVGAGPLAELVDGTRGCDALLVQREDDDVRGIVACAGPSMRTVVGALAQETTEPRDDGSLAVAPMQDRQHPRHCSVEPTRDPARTRIVCAEDLEELDLSRQYLGRMLDGSAPAGSLRFSLAAEAVRGRFGAQARAGVAFLSASIESGLAEAEEPLLRSERVRSAIAVLARDVLDDVGALVDEMSGLELLLALRPEGVVVDFDVSVASPTGSLVRAFADATRPSATMPSDLVERLPPGAYSYSAGRVDASGFDSLFTEIRDVLTAVVQAGAQLPQADLDALERALALMLRANAYEFASASGQDQNTAHFTVSHYRYADAATARAAVDGLRQAVAAIRRPAVARALDALIARASDGTPAAQVRDLTELRLRGLPAGSFAVRFPSVEALFRRIQQSSSDAPSVAPPLPAMSELLLALDGATVTAVYGTGVEARFRAGSAGGLSSEIRSALSQPGAALNMVFRLGNYRLPNEPVDDDAGAPTLESRIGVEAGQALIVGRVLNAGTAPNARFELDLLVPTALVRSLRELD